VLIGFKAGYTDKHLLICVHLCPMSVPYGSPTGTLREAGLRPSTGVRIPLREAAPRLRDGNRQDCDPLTATCLGN